MQSLTSQFYAFLVTILAGLTIGTIFDSYRVIRGLTRPRKVFTYLGDLAFWVISTLVVFFMLLIGNWGEIRFYVLFGVLLGTMFYFKYASNYFVKFFGLIIYVCKKTAVFLIKFLSMLWLVITYPFIIIRNIVIIPVGFLGMTSVRGIKWVRRITARILISPAKGYVNRTKNRIKKLFKK